MLQGSEQQVFLRGPPPVQGCLADGRAAGDPVETEAGPADLPVNAEGSGDDPPLDVGVGRAPACGLALRFRAHGPEFVTPAGHPFRVYRMGRCFRPPTNVVAVHSGRPASSMDSSRGSSSGKNARVSIPGSAAP